MREAAVAVAKTGLRSETQVRLLHYWSRDENSSEVIFSWMISAKMLTTPVQEVSGCYQYAKLHLDPAGGGSPVGEWLPSCIWTLLSLALKSVSGHCNELHLTSLPAFSRFQDVRARCTLLSVKSIDFTNRSSLINFLITLIFDRSDCMWAVTARARRTVDEMNDAHLAIPTPTYMYSLLCTPPS